MAVPRRWLLVSREDAKTRRKRRGDVEPRMDTNMRRARARARARARRPTHGSNLRFPSRLRVRKTGISVPDRRFRLDAARAFQREICPLQLPACELPLRGGGGASLASRKDAKTRREKQRWWFSVRAGSPANACRHARTLPGLSEQSDDVKATTRRGAHLSYGSCCPE